uniref:Uncharacterized protein n=1 Tax=Anguilla anguilla TaxID=7936 RepID=A0A0E9PM37_ANGAN
MVYLLIPISYHSLVHNYTVTKHSYLIKSDNYLLLVSFAYNFH